MRIWTKYMLVILFPNFTRHHWITHTNTQLKAHCILYFVYYIPNVERVKYHVLD